MPLGPEMTGAGYGLCWNDIIASNVPNFDSHSVLCITVWELNSGKFQLIYCVLHAL